MPLLFSYGTLQQEKVQVETFGRTLHGTRETLTHYTIDFIEIADPEVLRRSEQQFHPILRYSGQENDRVEGLLFEISDEELLYADAYEVDDYKRIAVVFASGNTGFIYVEK